MIFIKTLILSERKILIVDFLIEPNGHIINVIVKDKLEINKICVYANIADL